jgi:hypothetical protein
VDLDRRSSERLNVLSELIGEGDLAVVVRDLARSALATVPSFLALQVTVVGAERPITVSTPYSVMGKVVVRSSLRLEIEASESRRQHRLVYLAERADAFFEFRDNFRGVCDSDNQLVGDRIQRLVVDDDVPADRMVGFASPEPGAMDDGESSIQRVIGVLISWGFSAQAARAELDMHAIGTERTAADEARHLLRSIIEDHPSGADLGPVPR